MLKKSIYGILFSTIIFVGCGTESEGGKFIEPKLPFVAPIIEKGIFLDSLVDGVGYKSTSLLEGETDSRGTFNFYKGDRIEFFVADVSLGEVEAKHLITIDDFPYPTQVAQFLQTLDRDNFVENGIYIHPNIRNNLLLLKVTPKEDNSSRFAKELNIELFDDSEKNNIFMEELFTTAQLQSREIVSSSAALAHSQKAARLKSIYNNNYDLYNEIVNKEANSTDGTSMITFEDLKSRLIFSLYRNGYRGLLVSESKESYVENYKIFVKNITELSLYTDVSSDTMIKVLDLDIGGCISSVSFENNLTQKAEAISVCSKSLIESKAENFEFKDENILEKSYLDLVLSCSQQDKVCLANNFEGNITLESQLEYLYEKNSDLYTDDKVSLVESSRVKIEKIVSALNGLVDEVSKELPEDASLNGSSNYQIPKVLLEGKFLSVDNGKLWVEMSVHNRTGSDINITSFSQKIILFDESFNLFDPRLPKDLNRTFLRTSKIQGLKIPISLESNTLVQEGNGTLVLKLDYKANDRRFEGAVQSIVELNFSD